jgi:hypothetical protein
MSAKDKAKFLRRVADRLEENLPDGRGRHDDRFREAYAKAKCRYSPSPRYLFFLPSVAEGKNVDERLRRSHSDRGFRRALQRIGLPTRHRAVDSRLKRRNKENCHSNLMFSVMAR